MGMDLAGQVEIAIELLVAAVLGAIVGLEREIHDHPAGMRTHMLVAIGSAAFTVLSINAFGPEGDPARVAAQIVTGVGFLGAGAILKEGANVRGLTTAASLWAVAAVGMAAGSGLWVVGLVVTLIVVFSLWPLRLVAERYVGKAHHAIRVRFATTRQGALVEIIGAITRAGGAIDHLETHDAGGGRWRIELDVRFASAEDSAAVAAAIAALPDLEIDGSILPRD